MLSTKRTDTYDVITYQCENEDGNRIDLTGASVRFIMGKKNKLITDAPASITSSVDGIVQYQLTEADTLVSGQFLAEFEVTFPNGTSKTFPSNGYITVNISDNLDNGQVNVVLDMVAAKQGEFEAKLDSILKQAGNIEMSTIGEYSWTSSEGQVTYIFPANSGYDSNVKWFEVLVGNLPVDNSLVIRTENQFTLNVAPENISSGLTVEARWILPMSPIVPTIYKDIPQQVTPPTDAVEGDLWIDTSDNDYQGTVFEDLQNNKADKSEITSINLQLLDNTQRSKNVWLDLKEDFGAVGNGIADDTTAIRAAYQYANTNGSVKLFVPEGTYCISDYIQVFKNTTVEWHPNAVFKRIGTYFKMFANGDLVNKLYVLNGGYTGDGNIEFRGGTFDMNCQVGNTSGISPDQTVSFFDLGHAKDITFKDITVKNGQNGHYFQISSCKNIRFKDCWFGDVNYTGDGSNYSYECIQIEVATAVSFPSFGAYDLTISKDIYIEGCIFDGVIRGIGTHSDGKYGTPNVIFCENIQIKDCVFKNVTDVALNLTGYRYSLFENNTIDTVGGYAFNINVCEDNRITNNDIINIQKAAFNITSSHNNKFAKNKAKEIALTTTASYAGFRLSASNGNTFDDDTITAVSPNYTYAWYQDTSDSANPNRIISHNFTKGKTATIGGSNDTDRANIGFGGGQTVLFDGDISTITTPVTLPHDIRNFNFLVVMGNANGGIGAMVSQVIPKSAIIIGSTTGRYRFATADSASSAQVDYSFPTATSIQADIIMGSSHIRKVIGII